MGPAHLAIYYAALLAVDPAFASHHLAHRAAHSIHQKTFRHTRSLTRDLRVAFGTMFTPRADVDQPRVVYCKSGKQVPFGTNVGTGGSTGNNTTGISASTIVVGTGAASQSSTSTQSSPGPTATTTTRNMPSSSTSATSHSSTSTQPNPGPTATITSGNTPSSPWNLVETHEGQNFFDGWDFFTGSDPTNGTVLYVDQSTASSNGLMGVNSQGHAVMRVETTPVVASTRQSVRISTQRILNGGLIIMDSVHMPTGCGIWPAFWTTGPNWPSDGEVDIVEGVHDYTNNQATLHTNPGCTLASTDVNALGISGTVIGGTDCAAGTTGNQGCGIRASTGNTFGAGFNSNGGGVYAMKWDVFGIAVYFFPPNSVPSDITAEAPLPDTWGPAQARWPAASCDPTKFFVDHQAIFDTTLCGVWAGNVWNIAGIPGQDQSCAQRTGVSTCEAFVQGNGAAMAEAYWEIKSVKIYL